MLFKEAVESLHSHESCIQVSNTKILIVSSAQGCIGYENLLRRHQFRNVETCTDAITALQRMEHEPPDVLIMDAEMDDIDGYELASNLRDIESSEHRFTYVLLISREISSTMGFASQANVDVILTRDSVPFRLIPQIMAAERLAVQTNMLLRANSDLGRRCSDMEAGQLLDPLTGLGNRRQAMKGMEDTIRQIEARGGAIALLLVKMMDLDVLMDAHDKSVTDELIVAIGDKVRRLVRPLDIVTYFDRGIFAVVMQHDSLDHCKASSYERIREGLVLKNFSTRAGYLQPAINIGACGAGAETGPPKIANIVAKAMSNLSTGHETGQLNVSVLNPFEKE